jgi:hypothetical protein
MTISIPGSEALLAIVGIFGLVGVQRGWRRMAIVLMGTMATALVLLEDREGRMIKVINSLPKVVDLLLDTKLAATPLINDANRPYSLLGILAAVVLIFWILSGRIADKPPRLNLAELGRTLPSVLVSLAVGAATGYLLLIKAYEYLLILPRDAQDRMFQTITIVLLPLPTTNIFREYEAQLFLGMVVVAALAIPLMSVVDRGRSRGKTDSSKGGGNGNS